MCNNNVKAIMKKIYSFLFAATALFAAASCQKEVAPEVETPNYEKITFTASTEVETKTALHQDDKGKTTIWVAGDKISVFDADKTGNNRCFEIAELSKDARTATFSYTGEFVMDNTQPDPTVVALYPYQKDAFCNFFISNVNDITGLYFPSQQIAEANSFDSNAAFALGLGVMSTKELGFQNLYALLKFTVRDAGVKKVTVKVNEGAYIAGDAKVHMELDTDKIGFSEPVFHSPVLIVEKGTNEITLTCEDGFNTEATYYVAVVPTTIESIAVYFDENETSVNSKTVTMTLAANKIYNLKDLGAPKAERNLAFENDEYTVTIGDEFTAPELKGATEGVKYVSSNTTVAEVDASGKITVKAVGTTTITASAEESRYYLAGEASYTLTVKEPAVIRIDNKNGWEDLKITIKSGNTTLVSAKAMTKKGNNIFAYSLDSKYVGTEVTYYLEHSWYQTSTKTTTLKADSEATAITLNTTYLEPGTWDWTSATFGAWMWGSGVSDIMVTGVKVKDNFFEFEIPADGYKSVIFVRCNKNNADASWDTKWNQTGNLTLQHKCYCVNTWDNGNDTRWF